MNRRDFNTTLIAGAVAGHLPNAISSALTLHGRTPEEVAQAFVVLAPFNLDCQPHTMRIFVNCCDKVCHASITWNNWEGWDEGDHPSLQFYQIIENDKFLFFFEKLVESLITKMNTLQFVIREDFRSYETLQKFETHTKVIFLGICKEFEWTEDTNNPLLGVLWNDGDVDGYDDEKGMVEATIYDFEKKKEIFKKVIKKQPWSKS